MAYDAQAFASGQSASGNGVMDMLGQQMAGLQVQNAGLQQQAARQQMAMQRIALQRQQQYTQDVSSFAQNPTVNGLASLWKYPEFQASTKGIYDAMDPRMRQAEATQLGSFASVLTQAQNKDGTYDPKMLQSAADIVQQRIAADKAAGRDTTDDERALSMVQSGDPKQINAVKAMTAGLIAGAVGFDKAGDYLKAVGFSQEPVTTEPGKTVTNPLTGGVVASQPSSLSPQTLNEPGGGQELVGFNPNPGAGGGSVGTGTAQTGGGDPASGGGAVAGGMQASIAHAIHNEGRPGNSFNPKDANGSPTNWGINFKANQAVLAKMGITAANFKDLTQQQAEQIYATKYWPQSGAAKLPANMQAPYFDVYIRNGNIAKMAWKQSGGDPAKFMQIANAAFQKMASNPNSGTAPYKQAWANRDAGNLAIATGGNAGAPSAAPANAQGGAPNAPGNAPQVAGPGGAVVLANTGSPGALNTQGAEPGYAWNPNHTAEIPTAGGSQDPFAYDPGMIRDLAWQTLQTGQLPSGMGMGGAALKKIIFEDRNRLMQQLHLTPNNIAAFRSQFQANQAALQTSTTLLSSLESGGRSLNTLAGQVVETSKQLQQDGILGRNAHINRANIELYSNVGSQKTQDDIRKYETAVQGYATDYSKYMSSASGMSNAPASDAARNTASDVIELGLPHHVMIGNLNQTLKEVDAKHSGVLATVESLKHKLAAPPVSEGSAPTQNSLPAGAKVIGTYKGRRVIEVNGQRLVEQ